MTFPGGKSRGRRNLLSLGDPLKKRKEPRLALPARHDDDRLIIIYRRVTLANRSNLPSDLSIKLGHLFR